MNEPIRVLHVCQRMEAAGVQSFIMNIYRNIDRKKIQFDFLVHYKENQFFDEEIRCLGGNIYTLSVREDYNLLKYWSELTHFFKEHKYDIIHGHMDTLGAIYLKAAKKNKVRIRIAHAHTDYVQSGIKKIPRLVMIKLFDLDANQFFACSNNAGRFMHGKREFDVYRNAIDLNKYKYNEIVRAKVRNELGLSNCFVLGNVGRFHVVKNQVFILKVVKELIKDMSQIRLLLVGGGRFENELLSHIKNLNIEKNVILLKDRKDVNELYQAMDVFMLPSLFEGIPLVGIEAQTAGLPCIFSDRVNKEVSVTPNSYFLSIDNGVDEWVSRIKQIYSTYIRENCLKYVQEAGYDSKIVAQNLMNFYLNA